MHLSQKQKAGYVVLAVLLAVGLGMAAFTTAFLLNSYRCQNDALVFRQRLAVASADSQFRRDLATATAQAAIAEANDGTDGTGLQVALPVYAAPGGLGLGSTLASSGPAGTLPDVVPWSPTNGAGYSLLPAPLGMVRPRGDSQLLARRFTVLVNRQTSKQDSLDRGTTNLGGQLPLSVLELPTQQFALAGKALDIPAALTVGGSVIGESVNLGSGASVAGTVTVTDDATWSPGAAVRGIALSRAKTTATSGAELAKSLEAGVYTSGQTLGPESFSVVRASEQGMLLQLGDSRLDAEGIPRLLLLPATPTRWDAYTLPAYQCSTLVSAVFSADRGTASVTIATRDLGNLASRLVSSSVASFSLTAMDGEVNGVALLFNAAADRALLRINPSGLANVVGIANARAVYVDVRTSGGLRNGAGSSAVGVLLSNQADLQALQGFSLVTPNTLTLSGSINTTTPPVPMSLFAHRVFYGLGGSSRVTLRGQRQAMASASPVDVSELRNELGAIPAARKTLEFADISTPEGVPPVILKQWLFLAE